METSGYYLRDTTGKVFGPIALEQLKQWVRDGRVEPLAGISADLKEWRLAPLMPELEMNWVVENNPGQFYGPTHRNVVDDFVRTGVLSEGARFYHDDAEVQNAALKEAQAALAAEKQARAVSEANLREAQGARAEMEAQFANVKHALTEASQEKERWSVRVREQEKALAEKDLEIARLNAVLKTREATIAEKDAALAEQKKELARKEKELARKEEVHARTWREEEVLVPEIVDEPPPNRTRAVFGVAAPAANAGAPRPAAVSASAMFGGAPDARAMAALEAQARSELARMGASGKKFFFTKRK